ncbi:MAG: glycosyltransferase family 4 protein [Chthonomonadales bacterium]|nr:glycosyltransferase family 4 protein [Chthonomonadales bacterium]
MRVAIVSSAYWPIIGGQMIYARDLAQELVRQGHEVTVATRFTSRLRTSTWESLSEVDPEAAYDEDGVQVRVLCPRGLRRLALLPVCRLHWYSSTDRAAIALFRYALLPALRRAVPACDVIHFNGVGRELFGYAAQALAHEQGVPFIMTTHVHPGTWGDSPLDFRLYCKADRILAHTEWEKAFYVAGGVPASRVEVVGIGVPNLGAGDGLRAREKHGLGDHPIVLFVARKAHYKGYGLLLESAPIVWESFPEVRFVFVGPDQDEPTASQRRLLEDARIIEPGPISNDDREDLYAACTLLCVPSQAESFGLIYLEAGLHGKPVVALDIGPLRELIGASGSGILAESSTPAAVAAAIMRLLSSASLAAAMGAAGRQKARAYSPEAIAQRVVSQYVAGRERCRAKDGGWAT